YRVLKYFRGVEELGPLLAGKLLGLVLLSFVSILVLSNVVTALSSFFLARDLDLLVSSPVDWLRLYLAKLGEPLLHSSWLLALPERLARPEGFRNLLDFITVLRTPTSPFLPSEWATQAIMSDLRGGSGAPLDPLPLALLWTTAAAFVTLGALLHRELYATGF